MMHLAQAAVIACLGYDNGEQSTIIKEHVDCEVCNQIILHRNHLLDLLLVNSGLSEWEIGFLDQLYHWRGPYTEKQSSKLMELYEEHCR